MKSITITLTDDIIELAFQGQSPINTAIYTDTGSIFRGGSEDTDAAIELTLIRIRDLMKDAAHRGWEYVREKFDMVIQFIKDKSNDLGEKAKEYKDRLMERIKTVFVEMYNLLLSTLKNKIKIGELYYQMETVEIEHVLKLTGELEVSIEMLCKFATEGEISIKGSYVLLKP